MMNKHYITQAGWRLVDKKNQPVALSQEVKSFRGEVAKVLGGKPPPQDGSTGKVWTTAGEFYPSVYDLRWVQ